MRTSRFSYTLTLTFLVSIWLLRWWARAEYPFLLWMCLIIVSIAGIVMLWRGIDRDGITLAVSVALVLAVMSVARVTDTLSPRVIAWYADTGKIWITGMVSTSPQETLRDQTFALRVSEANNIAVGGGVLITENTHRPVRIGDTLQCTGSLELPAQNEDFNQAHYLAVRGISTILQNAHCAVIRTGSFSILASLHMVRSAIEDRIARTFPEPSASLLQGLLLGTRVDIPEEMTTAYRATGLTHTLAISGTNITIILSVLGSLLFWLPLRWRTVPLAVGITLFTLLVGAEASVVRAAIMGVLGLSALHAGRMTQARLMILWTLFFMLLWNPLWLWWDAGFQLSFLALIGLTEGQPVLDRWCQFLPEYVGLRESFATTMAAQIFATPWIIYLFGQLSLIAPLANVLVLPVIPWAMLFGFLATLGGFLHPLLGMLLSVLALPFLWWMQTIPVWLSHLPFAALMLPTGTSCVITLYYVVVGYVLLRRNHHV